MSILAAVPKKHKKITRNLIRAAQRRKIRTIKPKTKKLSKFPVTKSCSINSSQSLMQDDTPLVPKSQETSSLNLKYFQSYNPYTLGSLNSIVFSIFLFYVGNGRIYDLLFIKKDDLRVYKAMKCKCSKSKCSAKYCDCFANGQACGSSCSCIDCQNSINFQSNSKHA